MVATENFAELEDLSRAEIFYLRTLQFNLAKDLLILCCIRPILFRLTHRLCSGVTGLPYQFRATGSY